MTVTIRREKNGSCSEYIFKKCIWSASLHDIWRRNSIFHLTARNFPKSLPEARPNINFAFYYFWQYERTGGKEETLLSTLNGNVGRNWRVREREKKIFWREVGLIHRRNNGFRSQCKKEPTCFSFEITKKEFIISANLCASAILAVLVKETYNGPFTRQRTKSWKWPSSLFFNKQ